MASAMALSVGLLAVGGLACDRSTTDEPAATSPVPTAATPAPTPAPEVVRAPSLLDGVLDAAIAPPPSGGSTYRVDAYLAALVVEQLRRDAMPFTAWRGDGDDPARASAGYRVGPLSPTDLWTRIGLAEGDIIQAVNGISTDTAGWTEDALPLSENRVTVTVFRDDLSFVLSYRLMGGMTWSAMMAAPTEPSTDPAVVAVADPPAGDEPSEPVGTEDKQPGAGGPSGAGGSSPTKPSPSTGSGRPSPSKGAGTTPRPSKGSPVARCRSSSDCSIDKAYFNSIVKSPSKLESQARIVPAIRNDVHSGYKLKSVRSGSAVAQLGFRTGDKITHINGRDLTNEFEAMQLYLGLSGTRKFRVRYERGGSVRNKTIAVE